MCGFDEILILIMDMEFDEIMIFIMGMEFDGILKQVQDDNFVVGFGRPRKVCYVWHFMTVISDFSCLLSHISTQKDRGLPVFVVTTIFLTAVYFA
jgi:hypothetical protein